MHFPYENMNPLLLLLFIYIHFSVLMFMSLVQDVFSTRCTLMLSKVKAGTLHRHKPDDKGMLSPSPQTAKRVAADEEGGLPRIWGSRPSEDALCQWNFGMSTPCSTNGYYY